MRRTPSSHEIFGSQPVSRVQLLVADAQRHHVGRARAQPALVGHDVAVVAPEAVLLADAEDQVDPVGHRDVLALPVDVDVAGHAVRRDHQVAAHAVGAEAEVAERVERAQLDLRPRQSACVMIVPVT